MIPPERDYSTKWYYQCIQSRYGFNPHHLMLADACEFFIGQGCKVGLGGHLMGQKVTEQVAEMRSLPAGIDQRSPARHPDWLGPDDLSLKVQEIREATDYRIPIQLKLGASRVYDDVRMAAKCGPDIIYLDGAEGGTGAGPHIATEETGIPLMAAIPEARRALEDVGLADEIDLVVAGGIRNGADVAKCIALGAKAVAIGHSALMALNCNKEIPGVTDYEGTVGVPAGQCYHCHTGRCPVGITTQDPELRKRLVVASRELFWPPASSLLASSRSSVHARRARAAAHIAGDALHVALHGGGFLAFPFLGGFFVEFAPPEFSQHPGLLASALEAPQGGIEILVFSNPNARHRDLCKFPQDCPPQRSGRALRARECNEAKVENQR